MRYVRRALPLSLKMVSSELSIPERALKYHAPDLCVAISKRYKEQRTLRSKIHDILKDAIKENPPAPFKEILGRTKYSRGVFYKYWPELCYQVTERYRQHKKEMTHRKKEELKEAIRSAISSLNLSGLCPSQKRVSRILSMPNNLNFKDFYMLYWEVRRELSAA